MSGRFLLILLVGLGILGFFAWRWFVRTPPEEVARKLRQSTLWIVGGILILLAATGRANWFWALLGGALPLAQRVFMLWRAANLFKTLRGQARVMGGAGAPAGRRSTVNTRYLRMRLDHDSGDLSGEVIAGGFSGRSLDDLLLEELLALYAEVADDPQSRAVLEAYLDRRHGDVWRQRAGSDAGADGEAQSFSDAMTREEAYQVLGLEPGAGDDEIVAAHRRLMQKLHPDRGGSTFLAAKINQAKDLLLGERKSA